MDSMDVNEITKVIDGVYKNITDNFNPASKQMIATGKAYLKSLHGASAACSMYLEALTKLSKQAQQSSVGTSLDIGSSMMQIADVFKEIHAQQLTTLKAFYVDFLVPLETNLEKDVKVIQNEQKKFLVSHKHRVESYNKAVSNAKKVRKKSKKSSHPSSNTLDKEIRIMQTMEEERSKLEAFCEEALREALTQERRRYGFILERQASLAKHYLAFYNKGGQSLGQKLDQWMKVAKSREALPENMQNNLVKKIQQQGEEECIYCSPRRPADDTASISSQLRKTKSMEAGEMLNIQNSTSSNSSSGGVGGGYQLTAASSRGGHLGHLQNMHSHHHPQDLPITSAGALSRAKSDTSLGIMNGCNGGGGIYGTTGLALVNDHHPPHHHQQQQQQQQQGPPLPPPDNFRPSKSMALSPVGQGGNNGSTSSNQEPGHVGYAKALYAYLSNGDNQLCFLEGDMIALIGERNRGWQFGENLRTQKMGWFPVAYTEALEPPHSKSTADLMMMSKHAGGASPVPPPMPPPIPMNNNGGAVPRTPENKAMQKPGAKNLMIPSNRTNDSLHSSNDSGFSNDIIAHHQNQHIVHQGQVVPPPPQPEIDYSDEEPHLSNSEEIKPGNKWLMDRYHMSETARITSSTRRRSLSSGNLSTSDREQPDSLNSSMMLRNNNLRNSSSFVHNGAGNSPRGPHHQLANPNTFYDESKEGGALKKFLNRTKSLIWRRPSNAADHAQYNAQNGHDSVRIQRPQHALESISCADTVSELWGSHSSIVEMAEFEMKEFSPSSTIKREMMTMTEEGDERNNGAGPEVDYYANGNIVKNGRGKEQKITTDSNSGRVPTLPPRNDKTRGVNQTASNSMQLSPGSSSTNSNISIPKEADNSCLVVSDHTRAVKKDYVETYRSERSTRAPRKENDIDAVQQKHQKENRGKQRYHHRDEREEKQRHGRVEKSSSSSNANKQVARVESFAVSEAPILPEKLSRRGMPTGSVALSTRSNRSRATTITNGNHSEPAPVEAKGRRRIWQEHAINDDEFNSEEEKEVDEEEDEGTIDFNDNDEYDDEEAASSVFMDAENEQEPNKKENSLSMTSSGAKMMLQQHHKESKSLQCSASSAGGTKRSKSSDVTIRTDNSRRSRSSSAKTHGMNTVDMPKRHGGFIREKVSRSATVQNGLESVASRSTSKSRHHHQSTGMMRSSSSPAQRPRDHHKESEHKSSGQQSKKSAQGPMYKGRPIGSPPPIPAPLPQKSAKQPPNQPPPPPPPPQQPPPTTMKKFADASTEMNGDLTEGEPDYGTIKGSPSPSRKEDDLPPLDTIPPPPPQQKHQVITMKQTIVPYGKHQSLIIREAEGRKAAPRGGSAWKGSIRSEIHTVELITTADAQGATEGASSVSGQKPVYDYGSYIRRRLYYPERGSRLDQKSERSGNYCGPWYDLWGEDPSVSVG